MNALTHAPVGCGQIKDDVDTVIYIGDLAKVDCPDCLRIIEAHNARVAAERAAKADVAVKQALDALRYAKQGAEAPGEGRVDWTQVARDALTEALDALAEK